MVTNFKIHNFIEVVFDGRILDLHNNFSFVSYSHNTHTDELTLCFRKSTGTWVPTDEFDQVTFTLSQIRHLKTIDPDPVLLADDHCLSGITYYYPDEREENYCLLSRELPETGDDIIFTFHSDRVIRANCASATIKAERL